jgi:hypothetical protein
LFVGVGGELAEGGARLKQLISSKYYEALL